MKYMLCAAGAIIGLFVGRILGMVVVIVICFIIDAIRIATGNQRDVFPYRILSVYTNRGRDLGTVLGPIIGAIAGFFLGSALGG